MQVFDLQRIVVGDWLRRVEESRNNITMEKQIANVPNVSRNHL